MEPISQDLLAAGGGQAVAFYACAGVTIAAAILMVVTKNPVAGVMWLVLSFIGLAGIFVTLQSYFIAVVQVLVYAGAIMVLFLFVIMLLNLKPDELGHAKRSAMKFVGAATLLAVGIYLISLFTDTAVTGMPEVAADYGTIETVGRLLFTRYLLPFEVASILLLTAIIGAVAIAKRKTW